MNVMITLITRTISHRRYVYRLMKAGLFHTYLAAPVDGAWSSTADLRSHSAIVYCDVY